MLLLHPQQQLGMGAVSPSMDGIMAESPKMAAKCRICIGRDLNLARPLCLKD